MSRLICLALTLLSTQAIWGQAASPPEPKFSLPADKTPEQILALVALNLGVQEFKDAGYEKAIRYFIQAKRLDPKLLNAQLYLATAYASQYVPGHTDDENTQRAEMAVQEFRDALRTAPENLSAIDGLGSVLFKLSETRFDSTKLDESKSLFKKHIQIASNDPEPYYWVGAIDWTASYRAKKKLLTQFNESNKDKPLRETDPLPDDLRKSYAAEFGVPIDEGIDCLQRAMALRADYDDAMAYLNLLLRRKADTLEDPTERAQSLKMADDLIDKVKEIKAKRESPPQSPGHW